MIRLNAVLGKELTTRMRGMRASAIITGYLVVLATVSLLMLSSQSMPQSYSDSANVGRGLFSLLAGFQMALIIFVTPASTADAVSGERQRQTLDLLLVTRLSSLSIVLGKLIAGLAFNLLLVVCSLPLFSLVFLFGGVSPDQFLSVFSVFLATMLVLGTMSLFISTLMRRSGAAVVISLLCTLMLTIGLMMLTAYLMVVRGSSVGVVPDLPVTAYFDPVVGLMGALASNGRTPLNAAGYFTGGPLHLALWQDQVIVDVVVAIVFVLGSVRLLRPRRSSRRIRNRTVAREMTPPTESRAVDRRDRTA